MEINRYGWAAIVASTTVVLCLSLAWWMRIQMRIQFKDVGFEASGATILILRLADLLFTPLILTPTVFAVCFIVAWLMPHK